MADLALPLTQSEAFERTCATLGITTTRLDSGAGTCLIQSRRLPILGAFHLVSRGPVVQDTGSVAAFLDAIRREIRGPLVVNAPISEERIGGLKIVKGAELALVDLVTPDAMRSRLQQKWRNQLNKAEATGLVVTDQPLDATRHAWFLEAEAKQQKTRGYKSYPTGFLLAFAAANKGQARLYSAAYEGMPVAGMLILKHGAMATYQAGVTTVTGRQHCAHNLLLWNVMRDLQERGVSRLDLGRVDLSPGLRRFKLGCGAEMETLSGSYLFHHWRSPKSENRSIKKFSCRFRANS